MSQQLEYNGPRAFQTKRWKRGKVVAQILYVDEVCNDEVVNCYSINLGPGSLTLCLLIHCYSDRSRA